MSRGQFGKTGVYNSSSLTLSDGESSALGLDIRGYTYVTLADKIAGEDIDNDWMKVSLVTALSAILSGAENDSILIQPSRRTDAYNTTVATADATTAVSVKAATASKSIYITDISISTDTAGWIDIEDEDTNLIIGKLYLPANSVWSKSYLTPKKTTAANKAIKVKAQNAGNITVVMDGYVI